MQPAQSDDEFRHAGLSSNPVILNPADRVPPTELLCTKAAEERSAIRSLILDLSIGKCWQGVSSSRADEIELPECKCRIISVTALRYTR